MRLGWLGTRAGSLFSTSILLSIFGKTELSDTNWLANSGGTLSCSFKDTTGKLKPCMSRCISAKSRPPRAFF